MMDVEYDYENYEYEICCFDENKLCDTCSQCCEEEELLKEFILFYKKINGYEIELKESEYNLIRLFLGEKRRDNF